MLGGIFIHIYLSTIGEPGTFSSHDARRGERSVGLDIPSRMVQESDGTRPRARLMSRRDGRKNGASPQTKLPAILTPCKCIQGFLGKSFQLNPWDRNVSERIHALICTYLHRYRHSRFCYQQSLLLAAAKMWMPRFHNAPASARATKKSL